ncbi:hypothetical protein BCD67_10460 [Oscillatoriales cyanobacterium USR001]|nr:hypothetical protein BCD67_10460 [Oscillatoriales cyanobacterium USR001]
MLPTVLTVASKKKRQSLDLSLPSSFCNENPQWANANVQVEILSENTLLLRLVSSEIKEEAKESSLMMRLFLDMLMEDLKKAPSKVVSYTDEMMAEEDELLYGV